MPTANRAGLSLYFETYGDSEAPPMLLVGGLGMQLVDWPPEWLGRFVKEGYFVVAFDNRDAGLSTHLSSVTPPNLGEYVRGGRPSVAYDLGDMADDGIAVLDHLKLATAHIVGMSMGGMIAQQIAIAHAGRVRSLCSIMSSPDYPRLGAPTAEALESLLAPPPSNREEAIERAVADSRLIGSPGLPQDEAAMREAAAHSYDRSHDPDGVARQTGAIVASPDRTGALGNVLAPTVVIHGTADPLVQPDGGEATAAAVPGARLVMIEGMGHDLPPELWDDIVEPIVTNMQGADSKRAELRIS